MQRETLEQVTILCRCPSFLRKNVTPVKTEAGIQAPVPRPLDAGFTSGMTRDQRHGESLA